MEKKDTFNPNMLSSRQKAEVEKTGSFRNSRGEMVSVSAPPQPQAQTSNPLVDVLTERLAQQGKGISTSASSDLQASINEAIRGSQEAGSLASQALQSEREREVSFAQDRAGATYSSALESRTGYATQVVGLRELTETTEKSIRDLDKRYQEAILANDAATAQRVADMQFKKLEFLQTQEQQFYSNLFSLANIQEQEKSRLQQATQFERGLSSEESRFERGLTAEEERLERQLGFDLSMFEKQTNRAEREQMLSLAAEYGIAVGPNDTIDSMITNISPLVDERRRLELEAIRSEIGASKARAAEAMSNVREKKEFDSTYIDAYALAYLDNDKDLMVGLEEIGEAGPVLARVQEMRRKSRTELDRTAESASSSAEFRELAQNNPDIIWTPELIKEYEGLYADDWRKRTKEQNKANRKATKPMTFGIDSLPYYSAVNNNKFY